MELLIFIIPIITVIILVTKYRKETALWEYALVVIPTLILFVILKYSIIYYNSLDTEYYGDLLNNITYYEDWDETVTVTKTKSVPCGVDSKGRTKYRTVTYTERVRKYHPEKYIFTTVNGDEETVSYNEFVTITNTLKVNPVFKDMHRKYRTKDGDAYVYTWDRTIEHSYPITTSHLYVNKVKASAYSIFKYSNISKEEAGELGLYEYPVVRLYDQNPVLGYNTSVKEDKALRYLNGDRGHKNQFRLFILCYKDKSIDISEMQKAYWQGGNKNELVVCLGISGDSVTWCNAFSWCDEPLMEVKVKDYFLTNHKIDFVNFSNFVNNNIDINWKRKNFGDFSYINIECSPTQYMIILLIVLLYNISISYWVITNDFTESNPMGTNKRHVKY